MLLVVIKKVSMPDNHVIGGHVQGGKTACTSTLEGQKPYFAK